MNKKGFLFSGLLVILIAGVLCAGCTDDSSPVDTTPQISLVTTAPSTGPVYVSGDIVRNPKVSTSPAWLVMGYNSSADSYQRALIYPNEDGSWGYRRNSITDMENRLDFEKVFSEKITNKPLSSIVIHPVITATITTPTPSTNTTSTTTTTTVSSADKPSFKKIIPDEGTAGTAISITSLTGTNFRTGATVTLMMEDNPNITATNVNVQSPTLMTCTITPPVNTTAGAWDVVITNPDGQFVRYSYIFSIHVPVGAADTTSSSGSEGISSVSPTSTIGNDVMMTITGSGFQSGNIKAQLTKSTGARTLITARNVRWDSATQVTAWFTILEGSKGTWTVVVINPDDTTRTLTNGFEIKA